MIIDGKKIANTIRDELKKSIETLKSNPFFRPPCLAVILVGNNQASHLYVNGKTKSCDEVGIQSLKIERPASITEHELIEEINRLNADPTVDGILVQLPLPPQINPNRVMHTIDPKKDVDGFHPYNMGKLLIGETDGFIPCTPLGIITLLQSYQIDTTGKHALVIGRSNIVGKPTAVLLMQMAAGGNATVTVAHRFTKNLHELCQKADIIVAAIGKPLFIKSDMVKEGVVIIDVGMNQIEDATKKSGYKIVGDVDFDQVAPKCSYITPVPRGVGPMTIAMLLQNTFQSYLKR
ncbi:MAG: bifunctional methylenetetrahydrofolate dehydrogenase/methenyltetrahydrofolate cyclohydrolase FolD [Parachlamydiaceae bacterium]|nr:bifunctional methylenetetrahydrofolate dehydrogenase/methenyltetrahydrofolate cyclohydrolase FolD [Parachlamydiaceae bacterium]